MHTTDIVAAMAGQSVTNGWDAVCAMNTQRVNGILFQQYLQNGPTNPVTPLRVILQGEGTNFWILDLVMGPPEVTFPANAGLQQVQVTMFLVRGALIQFDPNSMTIASSILVQPNESWLTGSVNLQKLEGQVNSVGQVVMDLTAGAYQPAIQGVDSNSVLATEIGTAVQTFFADNHTKYPLGALMTGGVAACLQPTNFEIVTQPAPDSTTGDGAVILLIKTNGTGGAVGQLNPYPIPSGLTAALMVSNQVIFAQLMPPFLTAEFQEMGTTFAGQQSGGVWHTVSSGGSISLPILGNTNVPSTCVAHTAFTSDSQFNPAGVAVLTDGFVIAPGSNGSISVQWNKSWDQQWAYWGGLQLRGWCRWSKYGQTSTLVGGYGQTSAVSVDPNTDIVSFSGSGQVTLDQKDAPTWWQELLFGTEHIPAAFTSAIQPVIQSIFTALTLPQVNTFALANLLFPSRHVLTLQQASVPCDLFLSGQMQQPLTVTPSSVNLQPGQTQQFSALAGGQPVRNVLWELKPPVGTITSAGLYAAPATINQAEVVVVTAISMNDSSQVGGAMALVYELVAATGLVVSPTNLMLTAGQTFNLLVTDENGSAVQATCTLSPSVGTLTQGWGTGQWAYAAPATVETETTVTVKATSASNPANTGTATLQVTPTQRVQITPAGATVTAGQSVQLQAGPAAAGGYTWQIFPLGAGSVTANATNNSQATYYSAGLGDGHHRGDGRRILRRRHLGHRTRTDHREPGLRGR